MTLRRRAGVLAAGVVVVAGSSAVPFPTAVAEPTRTVFHVSPVGDDGADGSAAHPLRTIAAATAAAPDRARIVVAAGAYGPFMVTRPGQRVVAASGQQVVVRGAVGVRDVVRITASDVTVSGMTVTGCVPDPDPSGGLEDAGSSDVRIDDGTTGVTVHRMTITDSRGRTTAGLPIGCYGIAAHHADAFRIVANDISGTGLGVYVDGGGRRGLIAANTIHDNDVIIRNTWGGDDDFGGNGVNLANVEQTPGVMVTRNTVSHNYGQSADYGTDGGAFELYNASHTTIVNNQAADNDSVLETGSSPGGGCVGNVFSGNDVSGRAPDSGLTRAAGLLLRCATGMVVDANRLSGLDWWALDIELGDRFSTDVDGLTVTNNTVRQDAPVYRLGVDPQAARMVMRANRFAETGSVFAAYADQSDPSPDLADWQRRTGQDGDSAAG